MNSAFDLRGKRILITGAAGAIGSATARACATLGASLILTDLTEPLTTADEVRGMGATVSTYEVDVTDREGIETLIADAGDLDAVVANAGYCPWDDWNDEGWDETFWKTVNVNVLGVFHLVRACLPGMTERCHGKIVIVSSAVGKTGGTMTSPHYVAAKGGLNAFIKWAARKAAPNGVLVNGVAPGATFSAMTQSQSFDLTAVPLRRMAQPEEIAWPIAFLCSRASDYICGTVLDVNGGVSMN